MSLMLRVLSPEGQLLETTTNSVRLPALDGSLGVMPGHRQMVLALRAGEIVYKVGEETHGLPISGGLAQVDSDRVTVLADAQ